MRPRLPLVLAGVLALAGCRLERRTPVAAADRVLRGGVIWTGSPALPWAEAVAVRDGRLQYVGDDEGVARFLGPRTRVLDLGGRLVLPGFRDTHAHPLSGGLELGECNLHGLRTAAEIEGAVRAWAATHPSAPWVRGNGWQLPVFPDANPRKELLDRAVPDRPTLLYAADGHSAWVNSRALALAGVTRETPDPPNGRIERDAAGEPTGTLREAAMALVADLLPPYSAVERIGAVRRALAEASRYGITAITDADADPDDLEAYAAVAEREGLAVRVTAALHVNQEAELDAELDRLRRLRARYRGTDRLAVNVAKLYADGVIEAHTAALLAPYLDRPGDPGPLVQPADRLAEFVAALDREGFQIHAHAIGDRAIRVTLDALAQARQRNGPRDARPVVAHLELFDPAELGRFRALQAVASIQPYWAQADGYIRKLTIPVLGPERGRWLYPFRSLLASGAVVAAGSDWTVSSLNPLDAIQVAMTRRGLRDTTGKAWIPEEQVDLPDLLRAYTINGAYATFEERETGSLEVGKLADLIVLDRNLFAVPAGEVGAARVLLTLLEGEEVWRDSSLPPGER